jgi:hypothetical protein
MNVSEPIVFISRFRIVEGRLDDFRSMVGGAVGAIVAAKPRTALFAAYLDPSGTTARIVHAFPDAAAIAEHFVRSDDRSRSIDDFARPAGFEILGRAPTTVLEQLRREADAGAVELEIFSDPIGGLLRAPIDV